MAERQSIPPAEDLAGWADRWDAVPAAVLTPSAGMHGQTHNVGPRCTSCACRRRLLSSPHAPQAAVALNVQHPYPPCSQHPAPKTSERSASCGAGSWHRVRGAARKVVPSARGHGWHPVPSPGTRKTPSSQAPGAAPTPPRCRYQREYTQG